MFVCVSLVSLMKWGRGAKKTLYLICVWSIESVRAVVGISPTHVPVQKQCLHWPKSAPGWMALFVNALFMEETSATGTGMILRDNEGAVISSTYRFLYLYSDALEGEISDILDGMSLSMQWSELVIIVQSDSSTKKGFSRFICKGFPIR